MEILINYATQGRLIKGSVHDVDKKQLEARLKDYDKQLYIKWNPKKNNGLGLWEVRRKPNAKTAIYKGAHEGANFYELEFKENDFIHHVLDAPVLDYRILERIKKMDAWNTKNWVDNLEYEEERMYEKQISDIREETKYYNRHFKKEWDLFREEARSGRNVLRYFAGKYKYFD